MSTTNERTLTEAVEARPLQEAPSAQDTVRAGAIRALTERGVSRPHDLLTLNAPVAILGWCRWWDRQRGVGKELLVERIRSGAPAPRLRRPDDQRAYCEEIAAWLKAKLPDVCDPEPHYAAMVAVIHLHHRYGRGSLTAQAHGAVIRAEVRAAERRPEGGAER